MAANERLAKVVRKWNQEMQENPELLITIGGSTKKLSQKTGFVVYVPPERRREGGDLQRYFNDPKHSVIVRCFAEFTHSSTITDVPVVMRKSLEVKRIQERIERNCSHRGLKATFLEVPHNELPKEPKMNRLELRAAIQKREFVDFDKEVHIWRFPRGVQREDFVVSRGTFKTPCREKDLECGANIVVYLDLECPICYAQGVDRKAYFECYHSVCHECATVDRCPMCRSPERKYRRV